jgi:toxin ParE1/3/4
MANRYKLTVRALEDLGGIWNYTFDTWSEAQADKYYQQLLKQCQEIADGKVIGKKYAEILDGLYGAAVGQHTIFYRFLDRSTIEITRILHSRMDLKSKFDE